MVYLVYRSPKRGKAEALRTLACFVEADTKAAAKRAGKELLYAPKDPYDKDWMQPQAQLATAGRTFVL